jgi:hypothetical protein
MRRFLLISAFAILSTGAAAQSRCIVTDPTGTPLNARSRPTGTIPGAVHTGLAADRDRDQQGRRWVFAVPQQGQAGWGYREFISCYKVGVSTIP